MTDARSITRRLKKGPHGKASFLDWSHLVGEEFPVGVRLKLLDEVVLAHVGLALKDLHALDRGRSRHAEDLNIRERSENLKLSLPVPAFSATPF